MVVVGPPQKETPITAASLINARRSLADSVIGGIQETQEMLDFCSKNNIACDIELIPIQKVKVVYEWVVNSDVRYRFVIDMKSRARNDFSIKYSYASEDGRYSVKCSVKSIRTK
jgi:uncharacterized zinc-type alcohol dehydrogenase-like protein